MTLRTPFWAASHNFKKGHEMSGQSAKCFVHDKSFVIPCDGLKKLIGRAVDLVQYTNFKTMEPSRSFVTIKSGEFSKQGLVANFCPVCGQRINHAVETADAS